MLSNNFVRSRVRWFATTLLLAATTLSSLTLAQTGGIEEVIVTAQKRSESLQDVPISVSAFDTEALDAKQIDNFSDLQFNVPNVSYTKSNFTGSNFTIRGIGTLLTATSGDSGVGTHVNDIYIQSPRLFETEYYDLEQVEILRGPQGTLFGRNTTAGAINLKTARPEIGELGGDIELQYGNFSNARAKGALNVPIGDTMALRVAGLYLSRDGYTDNLVTNNDIDDRDIWSVRGSFRWEIADSTTVDLIGSYFKENDKRTRSQKQFCRQDPSGILGCLSTNEETNSINAASTLGTLVSSNLLLGPLGVFDVTSPAQDFNPDNVRKVAATFDPDYEADETFIMSHIQHDWNEWLAMDVLVGYQKTKVESRQDYNGTAGTQTAVIPAGFCGILPGACTFFGTQDGGPLWSSTVPNPDSALGSLTNQFELDDRGSGRDVSLADSDQWSGELRFTTDLDGPWNFMLSGYYLDFKTETDYVVQAAGLDYGNVALISIPSALAGAFTPEDNFLSLGLPYFNSETDRYELESYATFGEVYFDATETVKLTLGLRYSKDKKRLRDRQLPLLGLPFFTSTDLDGNATYIGPDGSLTPVTTLNEILDAAVAAGAYQGDPSSTTGNVPFRDDSVTFDKVTGRFVVDWTPTLSFTDETLVYFSFAKGYKSGGLNPPVDAALFGSTPSSFSPENIDAYEIGTKNMLWDNRLQANFNVFYYDYSDLQIGKIVNRTSLNENTDAEIKGFEGEFILAPSENWLFNASFSYIDTELDDTETVDPADPTQGRQDVTLIKDYGNASNCAVDFSSTGVPASDNPAFVGIITGAGAQYIPAGTIVPSTPGVTDSAYTICALAQAAAAAVGYTYLPSGVGTNLNGNELPSSPKWTFSVGAAYTHYFDNGWALTGRADYYWQDDFQATAFNRPTDTVDSWDVLNAQITLNGRDDKWYLRAYVQNLLDDDNITGKYDTDPSSGLFRNAFFIEPRNYGATFGWRM